MRADGKPKVFISYSRKDALWRDRLKVHLRALRHFEIWDDELIPAGDDWKAQIDGALERARLAVMLVSADFLASDFIGAHEVPPLLERLESRNIVVVPLIVRPCVWKKIPWLVRLQARPRDGRALSSLLEHEAETHLSGVVEEMFELSRKLLAPPTSPQPEPASPRVEVVTPQPVVVPPGDEIDALAARLGVTPRPFTFETVRVDVTGKIIDRRTLQSRLFVEDLGEGVKLEMVAVPGGTFRMGSPDGEAVREPVEGPQRDVRVEPFFLGKFTVTQGEWARVAKLPNVEAKLKLDPSHFKGARRPVECVSWHDAMEFCARLERHTGRAYRLPSEAEWEYAARAGTTTPFAFGPTITPALVNYDGNFPYGKATKGEARAATHNVGTLGVGNAWGLYDMHGNVWEWSLDPWHHDYRGAPSDGRTWDVGVDVPSRVVRGGSWLNGARYCRSAFRNDLGTDVRYYHVGFRVLCSVARTS